eukprot:958831-Amphidinium_carterae.1
MTRANREVFKVLLSGLVFALSIDCFIRWSSFQLPDCIELGRQVWLADDTVQLLCTLEELEIAAVLFAVLFDASEMQLGPKSNLFFVGSAFETEFRDMVARLARGHIFADLPIARSVHWLGINICAGVGVEFHPH